MFSAFPFQTVAELQARGVLRVEDGNHGNDRPRPEEFGIGSTAFIRAADMDGGQVLFKTAGLINDVALRRIRKGKGKPGDILFSSKGTVGKLARVPMDAPPFVCSPQTTYWRTLDENHLDRTFLYAYMRSRWFTEQYEAIKGETDMADYASLTAQRAFRVPLPPIDFQRDVARVIRPLDDKIDLNRELNHTLETLARVAFGNAFPYKPGDDLPAKHRECALPEIFEVNPVRLLPSGTPAPYLEMANMPTNSARAIAWETRAAGSGLRFKNGDALVARITPCLENGKTAFVDFLQQDQVGWGSTEYIVIRSKPPIPLEYAYLLARTDEFRAHVIQNMTGTSGRQRANAECLANFEVVLPPDAVLEKFGAEVSPIFRALKANDDQSQTLVALRDTLLPKLLSGELRASQAEREIASHA